MSELRGRVSASQIAGVASLGAGAVHAAAAGVHAAAPSLARLFVAVAAAQLVVGVLMLRRRSLWLAVGTAVVNATAVAAWMITRFAGIAWIEGLEQSETPQLADSVCAALGVIAVVGALMAMRPTPTGVARGLGVTMPSVAIGAVPVAAMLAAVTSVHAHDESAGGQDHGAAGTAEDHHDAADTRDTLATPPSLQVATQRPPRGIMAT